MRIVLTKSMTFHAAHYLPTFPQGHKCRRMHGHTFGVDLIVEGEVDEARGYLIDYGDIKAAAKPLIEQLDHQVLNDVKGLDVPTAENISRWIYDRLKPQLAELKAVRVHETEDNVAEYRGP
ncbi:MAG: 6-carboxytetrahydropterin synthase QueD [Phycisphaeraceae bacterium]|nr:6-carboxytetrahydropterin synthase QueD [Phycisphaeraceae bacterium]